MPALEMVLLLLGFTVIMYVISRDANSSHFDTLKSMDKFCSRCGSPLVMDRETTTYFDRKTGTINYVVIMLVCPRQRKQKDFASSLFHTEQSYIVAPNKVEAIKRFYSKKPLS